MRAFQNLCIFTLVLLFWGGCSNSPTEGENPSNERLIEINISAPSLSNNLFETITSQPIAIYLPPSYYDSDKKYPVVYFLSGFITKYTAFLNGEFQGFKLKESIDRLIDEGEIKEMIVVIPNDDTFMAGSFYVNSSVRGNWEDYIVHDLVNYIDSHYRTFNQSTSRGIAGHSMGGFGALNLAMRHPRVFCAAYGLSPGLFDQTGLTRQGMFSTQNVITHLAKQQEFDALDEESAKSAFKSYVNSLIAQNKTGTVFTYAYGAAFSPNSNNKPPYIDYPYYKSGNTVHVDSTLLNNYENGFGGLAGKVTQFRENLLALKAIAIDYGKNDEFSWIPDGCVYFSDLLQIAAIPHGLMSFNGGHSDQVRARIENHIMPFFSDTLKFVSD